MRKLARAKRAVSSLVGGAILITIMLIGFGLIVWNGVSYDSYLQIVNNRGLLYQQQVSENLAIACCTFNQNIVSVRVTNVGPLTVMIARTWVTDISVSPQSHVAFNVKPYYVDPGRTITIGQDFGTLNSAHLYTFKFVTSRGNIFGTNNFTPTTVLGVAQGVGWLTVVWNSYLYTDNNLCLSTPCIFKPAWNLTGSGNKIQFNVTIINHWDRNVTLLKYTYLRFEADSGQTGNFPVYYIMDPGNTPNSPVCYTQYGNPAIVVPYNKTGDFQTGGAPRTVSFMDAVYYKGGSTQCTPPSSNKPSNGYYTVYVVVYFSYACGTNTCVQAQTIPFEASGLT